MPGKEKHALKDRPMDFNMQDTTCQILVEHQRRMSSMINVKSLKPVMALVEEKNSIARAELVNNIRH